MWFNPHLWLPSSMLLHNELQYEIDITALTTFLQISNIIAERFSPILPNDFSKSPTHFCQNHRISLLQIAEHFSSHLQDISPIGEQHTFFYVLFGEDPVSDLSLHVLWAPCSALWVVSYGSLVMTVPPTRAWALRSTLWTMG